MRLMSYAANQWGNLCFQNKPPCNIYHYAGPYLLKAGSRVYVEISICQSMFTQEYLPKIRMWSSK